MNILYCRSTIFIIHIHKRVKMPLPCNDKKTTPLDTRGSQIKSPVQGQSYFWSCWPVRFHRLSPKLYRLLPILLITLQNSTVRPILKIIHAWITKSKVAKIKLGMDLDILYFLASFHSAWKCTVGYWKSKITFNYILLLILWTTIMTGLEGSLFVP